MHQGLGDLNGSVTADFCCNEGNPGTAIHDFLVTIAFVHLPVDAIGWDLDTYTYCSDIVQVPVMQPDNNLSLSELRTL